MTLFIADSSGPIQAVVQANPARFAVGFSLPPAGGIQLNLSGQQDGSGIHIESSTGLLWFDVKTHGSLPQQQFYAYTVNPGDSLCVTEVVDVEG